MIPIAPILLAGCLAVQAAADHITVADLAPAFPGLEAAQADTPVALAPAPGVTRIFHAAELERVAARFHIDAPRTEICVERPVAPLDPARVLAAMQVALPGARIEILELGGRPAPAGEIEFPRQGLREGTAGAIWSGSVRYGGSHQFPVWARVSVRSDVRRVVTLHDLPPGAPISVDDVRVATREEFPTEADFAQSADQVVGKLPRAMIRMGNAIRSGQLELPRVVLAGETVSVDVWSGNAHLKLDAQAEAAGAVGQVIPVRNLSSQKRFQARIDGKGRVSVIHGNENGFDN